MDEAKDKPEAKKPVKEEKAEVRTDGKTAIIKNGVTRRVHDVTPYLLEGWAVK